MKNEGNGNLVLGKWLALHELRDLLVEIEVWFRRWQRIGAHLAAARLDKGKIETLTLTVKSDFGFLSSGVGEEEEQRAELVKKKIDCFM